MRTAPGWGWKIYTAAYALWTGFFSMWDTSRGHYGWAFIQLVFFALALYWLYRVWVLRKHIF